MKDSFNGKTRRKTPAECVEIATDAAGVGVASAAVGAGLTFLFPEKENFFRPEALSVLIVGGSALFSVCYGLLRFFEATTPRDASIPHDSASPPPVQKDDNNLYAAPASFLR